MLNVTKVHHVAVICSDYARSKAFYTQVLGFRVLQETYREARQSYKLDLDVDGRTQIELFSFPDCPPRPSTPEARGLRHLAFSVPDMDDAVRHLRANGVTPEDVRVDALTGKRFTFFRDPDGQPLELYESESSP